MEVENKISISVTPLTSFDDFLYNIREIDADFSSPFQRLAWLETYNRHIVDTNSLVLVDFREKNKLVGTAFGKLGYTKLFRFFRFYSLKLFQPGNWLDHLTPEYNGIIAKSSNQARLLNTLLHQTSQNHFEWNCIELAYSQHLPEVKAPQVIFPKFTYQINLDTIRQKQQTYLSSLRANTRAQIRRSIREYTELFGDLQLKFPKNLEECLSNFDAMVKFHTSYWASKGKKNAFYTEELISFHKDLISTSPEGQLYIAKICAGSEIIGYIYNLVMDRHIYQYQSGLNYITGHNKLKPGLVAHMLLIEHHLKNNDQIYDLMAGEARYKINLSNKTQKMYHITIFKPSFKVKLLFILRTILSVIKR